MLDDIDALKTFTVIYQIGGLITQMGVLVIGVRIVRHITQMEIKVDLMWKRFERTMDIREEDKVKVNRAARG